MKNNLSKQNILFFTRKMDQGGTEKVVLQLCDILKPVVNKIIICSSGGINVNELRLMGIKHYIIPDITNKSIINFFIICKNLKKIVDKEGITIIHAHHRMAALYISIMRLYKKCGFIVTVHNNFNDKKMLTRFIYKHAKIIACGEMVKKNLTEFFGFKNVKVICNSVKPFNKSIIQDETIKKLHSEGYFVIGNIARLSEQKGIEFFIKSMPIILKKHSHVRFLLIGSGEEEYRLKMIAVKLGLKDKIYFLGYRNDIQNIISQVDLIVLSSLWEGFPLIPIETFSVGKTIVATSVDGTVEIVKDKNNGLLVKPKSELQIADKVNWMIEHKKGKKELEKNAKKYYNKELCFDNFAKSYKLIYNSI